MEKELSKVLVPAVTGLITGTIGSLIAPWVNWGIEKKKLKRKSQEDLMRSAREALSKEDLTNKEFRHLPIYSRIKPHLSEQAIKAIEGTHRQDANTSNEAIIVVMGEERNSGVNPFKNKVFDELAKLEKDWKLI